MNLYVGGDSFCFYRDNDQTDWPLILANKLSMTLNGEGYPGSSWWLTRKNLKDFLSSQTYTDKDVFVICHTDNIRPPINYFPKVDDAVSREDINRLWLKHFFSQEFSDWMFTNWCLELNLLLRNHNVIHLNCFEYEQKFNKLLNGRIFPHVLLNVSREELGNSRSLEFDSRRNHFSTEKNIWLAEELFKIINNSL